MSCVVDHLGADLRVRIRQDFTDAQGVRHRRGEEGVTRVLALNWARQELEITWERDGRRETLYFALAAKTGPGNGRMRDYFDVIERSPEPREAAARHWPPPQLPEPSAEPVDGVGRYGDGFTRLWALAARGQFEAAEEQLQRLLAGPDPHGGRLQQAAEDMVTLACRHAYDPNRAVFTWARERAIRLCYAWGSQATSGGEGESRMDFIRSAEEKLTAAAARRD